MVMTKLPCGHPLIEADVLAETHVFICGICSRTFERESTASLWRERISRHGAPGPPIDPAAAKKERDRLQDERLRTQMIDNLLRIKRAVNGGVDETPTT